MKEFNEKILFKKLSLNRKYLLILIILFKKMYLFRNEKDARLI